MPGLAIDCVEASAAAQYWRKTEFIEMSERKASSTRSAEIRERVGHPIIDSDGHVVEFEPALLDYIREAGGSAVLERYKTAPDTAFYFRWNHATPEERRELPPAAARMVALPDQELMTARLPLCRNCCTAASTKWASTSPCSIPARACSRRISPMTNCGGSRAAPSTITTPTFSGSTPIASRRPPASRCTLRQKRSRNSITSPSSASRS